MVLINLLEDCSPQYREPATPKEVIEVIGITIILSAVLTLLIMILFNGLSYIIERIV